MRLLPGNAQQYANETTTTNHLSTFMDSHPDFLPQVFTMFDKNYTAFTSLLARRNMYEGSLAMRPNGKGYRVVGNRKVMWNIKGLPERKIRFVKDAIVENETYPGRNRTRIITFHDSNWASPKEVLGLADDNNTQLYCNSDKLPTQVEPGCWRYEYVLNTNNKDDFANPILLKKDMEANVLYTQYEELSQTGQEKYTFDEKAFTFLTIQRMKWSISGSAEETKPGVVWMEHNKVPMWATKADIEMLARAAVYRENQFIFGKSTVSPDGKIYMKTEEGFEVCAGDGILNQGDGAWRLPYNELSLNIIDNLLSNVKTYSSSNGTEIALICGNKFYRDFTKLMKVEAGVESKVVEMDGTRKGINMDYDFYQWNGVRIIPTVVPWFDNNTRASIIGPDGIRNSSKRAIFCSLGDVGVNEPVVEMLALGKRNWLEGEVNGINKGGEMANSVDGKHKHILWETGVALKDINGIGELYVPFSAR